MQLRASRNADRSANCSQLLGLNGRRCSTADKINIEFYTNHT